MILDEGKARLLALISEHNVIPSLSLSLALSLSLSETLDLEPGG